jgi:hypothetical protein
LRLRFQDHWLYVYLLLEFQSTVDRFMAVRILSDTGLLYQDLIRGQSLHQDRLPPVLPIVLYNGEPRWKAAVDLSALIHPAPQELLPYQPQQRYLLLDEGAHSEQALAGVRNLVAAVFRLENNRGAEEVLAIVTALLDWLQDPRQTSLRRAFTVWIQRVILADSSDTPREPLIEFDEVRTMLAQRVQQWKQAWRAEGLAEGRAEGRAEGLKNERSTLLRMVCLRFDARNGGRLGATAGAGERPGSTDSNRRMDHPLRFGRGLAEPSAGASGRFPLARGTAQTIPIHRATCFP